LGRKQPSAKMSGIKFQDLFDLDARIVRQAAVHQSFSQCYSSGDVSLVRGNRFSKMILGFISAAFSKSHFSEQEMRLCVWARYRRFFSQSYLCGFEISLRVLQFSKQNVADGILRRGLDDFVDLFLCFIWLGLDKARRELDRKIEVVWKF